MGELSETSPALAAARAATQEMLDCIDKGVNFKLEAGAGAGKTHSLVEALQHIIQSKGLELQRRNQRVACITYTNVANDEIVARTDGHPVIFSATIHAFCWEMMKSFQPSMRAIVPTIAHLQEKIVESGTDLATLWIDYDLGIRRIKHEKLFIHHDDIIDMMAKMMEEPKFRSTMASRFPIMFIDEYQDTSKLFAQSLLTHFIEPRNGPLIGLFGDGWQKIYSSGAGSIRTTNLHEIGKRANFRSSRAVVDGLNRLRPELPQELRDPLFTGSVRVLHSNNWIGTRRSGPHSKGDLPEDEAHKCLQFLLRQLAAEGWDFATRDCKILMLTHAILGAEQGYGGIVSAFRYNDSFMNKEDPHLAYLMDKLELVLDAYQAGRFGVMFSVLGDGSSLIRGSSDKKLWGEEMAALVALRESGTVKDIMTQLLESRVLVLPDRVRDREKELAEATPEAIAESRVLQELQKLHAVAYSEVRALARFVNDQTPFATKHGVKGEEYENVLVVFGRGWNQYDWNKFLERHPGFTSTDSKETDSYERNRNLFYVACSRAKANLVLLFTQELTEKALSRLKAIFGDGNVSPFDFGSA